MELANCIVRLNGDPTFTVKKTAITPAEAVVLRAIHGNDALVDVKPYHMDKREHRYERARLYNLYTKKVVSRVFGGDFGTLPVTFADIATQEVDLYVDPEDMRENPGGSDRTAEPIHTGEPDANTVYVAAGPSGAAGPRDLDDEALELATRPDAPKE